MGDQSIQGLWGPLVRSGAAALFRLVSSFAQRDAQKRKIPDDESPESTQTCQGSSLETMTAPGPGDLTNKPEDFPASFNFQGTRVDGNLVSLTEDCQSENGRGRPPSCLTTDGSVFKCWSSVRVALRLSPGVDL